MLNHDKLCEHLISFVEMYYGFRNFTVRVIDKPVRAAVSWQNPRGCCNADFITGVKTHIEICGAGKCEVSKFIVTVKKLKYWRRNVHH